MVVVLVLVVVGVVVGPEFVDELEAVVLVHVLQVGATLAHGSMLPPETTPAALSSALGSWVATNWAR